eukprot:364192-Chlamydomonas_euryale.AAC.2
MAGDEDAHSTRGRAVVWRRLAPSPPPALRPLSPCPARRHAAKRAIVTGGRATVPVPHRASRQHRLRWIEVVLRGRQGCSWLRASSWLLGQGEQLAGWPASFEPYEKRAIA